MLDFLWGLFLFLLCVRALYLFHLVNTKQRGRDLGLAKKSGVVIMAEMLVPVVAIAAIVDRRLSVVAMLFVPGCDPP